MTTDRWPDPPIELSSRRRPPTVSVVIPARNDALGLSRVLPAIPGDVLEVILVDGHSSDDTIDVARRLLPDVRVVGQTRRGRGNALASGFEASTGEIIVTIDAAGSADPAQLPTFVAAIAAGADFVKGSRFMRGAVNPDISVRRRIGNACLNKIVNARYRSRYTDLASGSIAFRRHLLPILDLDPGMPLDPDAGSMRWGDGFEVETVINLRIAEAGLQVAEVPTSGTSSRPGAGDLSSFSEGVRVLRCVRTERRKTGRRSTGGNDHGQDRAPTWRSVPPGAVEATG